MNTQNVSKVPQATQQALESLLVINEDDNLSSVKLRVEKALGLSDAMPDAALHRMLVDDEYFHNLIAARSAPEMLAHLLHSPGNKAYDLPTEALSGSRVSQEPKYNGAKLVAKAATAFFEWSKGGFAKVEEADYERRITACLNCDKLAAPPSTLLYKVVGALADDKRTCRVCGCIVTTKAKLPHENCPLPAIKGDKLSRWGEPLQSD